jgi:CRISPR-associated protein Cas2
MYIILVYDIGQKRVGKMLKHCRKYLNWIQNSVFEGELTEVQIKEMMMGAKKIMKNEDDSVILFKSAGAKWLHKEIYGLEKMEIGNFI